MATRRQVALAVLGAVGFFLGVQLGALSLLSPFESAGYQAVENPQDPTNSLFYIVVLLVATAGMLVLFRYERTNVLRVGIVLTSGLISAYVFSVFLPPLTGGISVPVHGGAVLGALVVVVGLLYYPEWWVIDGAGLIMGMGAAALFGISLDVLPVLLLLVVLAVYDAVSVYGTEHMLTLAAGVMELRVPVIVIIPTSASYSFIRMADRMASEVDGGQAGESEGSSQENNLPETGDSRASKEAVQATPEHAGNEGREGGEDGPFDRDAFFIGLGDAVIPTILVASASAFLETPTLVGIEMASLGAIIGTLAGLLGLLWMVLKGRAHAGLPLLNGGSILGYLLGATAGGVSFVEALGLAPFL